MKNILCFGDSNTWGYDPSTGNRYPGNVRWTGVLRLVLGEGYQVIEEGLNGRTTVWDDPIEGYKNGMGYLIPCLESQRPIDLVIIMLGTNDLKIRFSVSAYDIGKSMGVLIDVVQKSASGPEDGIPEILIMAPPPVAKLTEFAEMLEGSEVKSKRLAAHYRQQAEEYNCHFLDTSQVIVSSDLDGIHLERGEHRKLGEAVAAEVKRILG